MRRRICQRLMLSGVTLLDPERVIIDDGVEIEGIPVCIPESYLKADRHWRQLRYSRQFEAERNCSARQ
ncbi:MAG: hypothetical protein KIT39_15310 [Nitrospirales bacterium]|nr:hypothetical protein [Nitrospirales bacterium]